MEIPLSRLKFVASRVSNELEVENVALYTLGIPSGSAIVEQWVGACQVGRRDKSGLSYDAEWAVSQRLWVGHMMLSQRL